MGQSTFMVEMTEVSNILKNATNNSLLILDEIGRGTSTFDGLSIAWSVIEYISKNLYSKTLFSTHYHELTELEGILEGVKNYQITVKEFNNSIIFLLLSTIVLSKSIYIVFIVTILPYPIFYLYYSKKMKPCQLLFDKIENLMIK